ESLAGRKEDAIAHLAQAMERRPQLRELAKEDTDFDPIREGAGARPAGAGDATPPTPPRAREGGHGLRSDPRGARLPPAGRLNDEARSRLGAQNPLATVKGGVRKPGW